MPRRAVPLACLVALIATAARAKPVEVTVQGMQLDPATGSPVVQLVERTGRAGSSARELPIWIGPFEAQAIALEIQGVPPPRPLTHDLMKQLVERLGGKLTHVEITDLRENTYFATLHLDGPDGKDVTVDARPSDAIALALRLHGPIMVAEEVFAKASAGRATPAAAHVWGLTVQDLTPDVARFFEAPDARGILVSDVEVAAPAHEVARGDVITALDGEPVATVEDLRTRAEARPTAEPVRLSVRRAGRRLDVRFAAP
ncbi:MAG TPA: bifunctional nuclease domain-containing protein [Candidatus Binatus sp.]|nr:bifunctional nuclease domain-containing protein [Candidatus Binatus sp.]